MVAFLLNLASLLLSFPLRLSCAIYPLLFSCSLPLSLSNRLFLFLYVCRLCGTLGRLTLQYSCRVKAHPLPVSPVRDKKIKKKLLAASGVTVSDVNHLESLFFHPFITTSSFLFALFFLSRSFRALSGFAALLIAQQVFV